MKHVKAVSKTSFPAKAFEAEKPLKPVKVKTS